MYVYPHTHTVIHCNTTRFFIHKGDRLSTLISTYRGHEEEEPAEGRVGEHAEEKPGEHLCV
jgi:hypothetical protein